jgi:hypothetical protein
MPNEPHHTIHNSTDGARPHRLKPEWPELNDSTTYNMMVTIMGSSRKVYTVHEPSKQAARKIKENAQHLGT